MSHTPGPWVVRGESGNGGEAEEVAASGRTIAWTSCSYDEDCADEITPEDRANARLIAAAPDLLAALKECREWLVHWCDSNVLGDSERAKMAAADAAIAKAEGRSE